MINVFFALLLIAPLEELYMHTTPMDYASTAAHCNFSLKGLHHLHEHAPNTFSSVDDGSTSISGSLIDSPSTSLFEQMNASIINLDIVSETTDTTDVSRILIGLLF